MGNINRRLMYEDGYALQKLAVSTGSTEALVSSAPVVTAGSGAASASDNNGSLRLRTDGVPEVRISSAWEALAVVGQTPDFEATGIKADIVAESTSAAGVTVDGVLLKDGGIVCADAAVLEVDTVNEATAAAGVTVDGVLLKDSIVQGGVQLDDGDLLAVLGAGTGTGDVVARFGATATEGLEVRVYEETLSPAAIETNAINVPANSRILSVQSNVETALTGGGTTDSYGLGTAGDPDKYGSSATLTQNSKTNYLGDGSVLTSSEQMVLTGTASETADGDTALTVGSVRVRVVYLTLVSLDNA